MTGFSKSNSNDDAETGSVIRLTPAGNLQIRPNCASNEVQLAFSEGTAYGLLSLLKYDVPRDASLEFWHEFAQEFVRAVADNLQHENPNEQKNIPISNHRLEYWLQRAPFFDGEEYLTKDVLSLIWVKLEEVLKKSNSVAEWLASLGKRWSALGKICLHLAENKSDPDYPFAFLATVANKVSQNGRIVFSALGKAVKEAEASANNPRLLALLEPLARAEKEVPWLAEVLASKEIFHPLAYTPSQAFAFLSAIPALEKSGIQVKVPNWWGNNQGKIRASITLGSVPKSRLGAGELLSFDVNLALGDEPLTAEEHAAILSSAEPFVQIRGQWVEIDNSRLQQTLQFWSKAAQNTEDGFTWAESMRMLAGLSAKQNGTPPPPEVEQCTRIVCGKYLEQRLNKLRHPESNKMFEPGDLLHAELRPYQSVGVSWLGFLQELGFGACLADDMGLGKTIQVISLLLCLKRERKTAPALLVAPASLLANWLSEILRFAPSLSVHVAHPAFAQSCASKNADLFITTYGQLVKHGDAQLKQYMQDYEFWHLVILDEAQAIKNPGSLQTRAVKNLKSRSRIALTGTPIENRLGDLWSLFDFLNPGLLGTASEFKNFAQSTGDNLQALQKLRHLIQPYILRRLKSDKSIIADLPEKTEIISWCNLSKKQVEMYSRVVSEFSKNLENSSGVSRKGLVLAYLTKFKQICNHPDHALGLGEYTGTESGKYARLRELCEEIASRQEKVIVFTQYQEMCSVLCDWMTEIFGQPGLVLDGSTAIAKRKKLVDEFQAENGPSHFVLSLKAGGTGLNLTAASHVIHFDRWWNPAVENQATDRAFRIGQKRNVLVHKFVCRGTLEERIDLMIESKKELATSVLGGGAELPVTELSNEALLKLVSLDIGSILNE